MHTVDDSQVKRSGPSTNAPTRRWPLKGATLALVAAFLASGCRGDSPCSPELQVGVTYAPKLPEYYLGGSAAYDARYTDQGAGGPSCRGFDGLVPGATISITTKNSVYASSCKEVEGWVDSLPNGEKWQEDYTATFGGGFANEVFIAPGRVVSGMCLGKYRITFGRPPKSAGMFEATQPGQIPNMVLARAFVPDERNSTCEICHDNFVAQLAVAK